MCDHKKESECIKIVRYCLFSFLVSPCRFFFVLAWSFANSIPAYRGQRSSLPRAHGRHAALPAHGAMPACFFFFCVTASLARVHWCSMSFCDTVHVCLRSICPVAQMPYLLLQGLLSHDAFCHILFLLRSLHSCPVTGDRHPGSSPVWQVFHSTVHPSIANGAHHRSLEDQGIHVQRHAHCEKTNTIIMAKARVAFTVCREDGCEHCLLHLSGSSRPVCQA